MNAHAAQSKSPPPESSSESLSSYNSKLLEPAFLKHPVPLYKALHVSLQPHYLYMFSLSAGTQLEVNKSLFNQKNSVIETEWAMYHLLCLL